jgi:anti-sigma factor RsiW
MRHAPVNGFTEVNAQWRTISGIDFQQLKPYAMAATPDPLRPALMLWLMRTQAPGDGRPAQWTARVVRGTRTVAQYVGASAGTVVSDAVAEHAWTRYAVTGASERHARDPYPGNYSHTPAGFYPDRPTAHDGRWDSPSGVM